ncbi:MAG TPA: NfeD family protein, partial [Gammaproteobacteria bacterium]|nr:NfeD family protein [Gammaproteobacteria bacterium]
AAAGELWGEPGVVAALLVALAVWDMPAGVLIDRCSVPTSGGESLPGREAVVVGPDEAATDRGRVRLDGVLWRARMPDFGTPFPPAGARVRVASVEGLMLVVERPSTRPAP